MSNKCFVRVFGKQSEIVKFLAERQQSPFLIYLLSSDPPILHHSWNPHLLLLELWHMSVPTPPPPTPLAFSPLSRNREGVYIVWTKVLHCSNIGFGLFLRFFLSNHSDLNSRYVENFYTKRWRTFSKIVTSDLY